MPFLPTLATVVVLATASLFCPNGKAPSPGAAARMIPASGGASMAMAEPVAPAAEPAPRLPAVVAFGEVYPLTASVDPATTSALPAPARAASNAPAKPLRRLAVTGRRPCVGRHCQDGQTAANPFAPAKPGLDQPATAEVAPASPVPSALPFTETVAEAVMPVAREVGAGIGARVNQITGTAGDLMRGGQSVVKGSVTVLADRLF
jgi:hypothetical protein